MMVVFLYTSCVILNIWEVMEIKVAVAGTGYVGMSTALLLSDIKILQLYFKKVSIVLLILDTYSNDFSR